MINPVIYLHLQKTAGNAIRNYLKACGSPPEFLFDLGNPSQAAEVSSYFDGLDAANRAKLRIVFGHEVAAFRGKLPNASNVTMVREPMQRAISQYCYERREHKAFGIKASERPLPGEVAPDEFWRALTDFALTEPSFSPMFLQSRTIATFLGRDPEKLGIGDIESMLDQFEMIGIQEHFVAFLFMFAKKYNFPLTPVPIVYSRNALIDYYVPEEICEQFRSYGHLDVSLYKLALKRFSRSFQEIVGTDQELFAECEAYRVSSAKLLEDQIVASAPKRKCPAPPIRSPRLRDRVADFIRGVG